MQICDNSYLKRKAEYFPEVTDEQWHDWHWQVKHRITSVEDLKKYIKLTAQQEEDIQIVLGKFRIAITSFCSRSSGILA